MARTAEERFWSKVDRNGALPSSCPELGPCWLWTGTVKKSNGYGSFRGPNGSVNAHSFSYVLHNGPVPEGHEVCHRCNVRRCVRPSHLRDDPHLNNMKDAVRAGSMRGYPSPGESNGLAKLTWGSVEEIRKLYGTGGYTQKQLANRFGVSHSTVGRIANNLIWKVA
jgi:hypothetical protein